MPLSALLLALAAAAVHALWNLFTARAEDPQAVAATALAIGVLAFAPVALLSGGAETGALPWAAASIVLEIAYFRLLTRAYAQGPLSLIYPVARGVAPVLVLAVGIGSVTALQAAGVLVIAAGVFAVRGGGTGSLGLALAVAVAIAGYTLVDKQGLEHADPLPYLELVLAPTAVAILALAPRRAPVTPTTALAGVGMLGAYGLTLAALAQAAAAPVAAVRETSVVIGVVLARLVLGERVTRARLAGAAIVSAGIALIALG